MPGVHSPVNAAFLSLYTDMGGGEYGLFHIVEQLDRTRFNPIVIVNQSGTLTQKFDAINVETVVVPFEVVTLRRLLQPRHLLKNVKASFILSRLVSDRNIKVMLCGDVLSLLLLLPAAIKFRVSIVYNVIFFYELIRMMLFNVFAFFIVDRIILLSNALKKDLLKKTVGLGDISDVVYWGVDTQRFSVKSTAERHTLRKKLNLPIDKKIVGCIGRYDTWKGHLTFLEAGKLLIAQRQDIVLLIVGGDLTGGIIREVRDYKISIERWIRENPMEGRLIVRDHTDNPAELFATLDVFVCPSDYEPFGLVVPEAYASGIPVVASRTVGALELFDQASRGIYVAEPKTPQSFVEQVLQALEDPSFEPESDVLERFSWESTGRRYEAQVKAVLQ